MFVSLLRKWGLSEAPLLISEDGTALQIRCDVLVQGSKVLLFGLNGGSFVLGSLDEFKQRINEDRLATTMYVYTAVPLVQGAPHFPIFAFAHDGSAQTFDDKLVLQVWQYLWQVCYSGMKNIL